MKYNELTINQIKVLCENSDCFYCDLRHSKGCIKFELEKYNLDKEVKLEEIVYQKMCAGCESERKCHIQCEVCESYTDALKELEEMLNDEDEEGEEPNGISICPNCDNNLYIAQKYCDKCGTKIDWSDKV